MDSTTWTTCHTATCHTATGPTAAETATRSATSTRTPAETHAHSHSETRTILRSDDLTCPSCIRKIETALDRREGVFQSKVHFSTGRIEVRHDPALVSAKELADVVRAIGYGATPSPF